MQAADVPERNGLARAFTGLGTSVCDRLQTKTLTAVRLLVDMAAAVELLAATRSLVSRLPLRCMRFMATCGGHTGIPWIAETMCSHYEAQRENSTLKCRMHHDSK